jgi:hypothetical protein
MLPRGTGTTDNNEKEDSFPWFHRFGPHFLGHQEDDTTADRLVKGDLLRDSPGAVTVT